MTATALAKKLEKLEAEIRRMEAEHAATAIALECLKEYQVKLGTEYLQKHWKDLEHRGVGEGDEGVPDLSLGAVEDRFVWCPADESTPRTGEPQKTFQDRSSS